MVTVVYRKSVEELGRTGVDILASAITRLLEEKDFIILAIPGGRSVSCIWNLLASDRRIPWNNVHVFMADERVVPPTHDDSNYRLAYKSFLKGLIDKELLPSENVHPFAPKESSDKGSADYYDELKKFGGKVDILVLGVGEDGHVGALYPNHHSVKSEVDRYIAMDDSPKPPAERITLSRKAMLKARVAVLLFIGEGKKEAYQKFNSGVNEIECPARLGKRIAEAYILTDIESI